MLAIAAVPSLTDSRVVKRCSRDFFRVASGPRRSPSASFSTLRDVVATLLSYKSAGPGETGGTGLTVPQRRPTAAAAVWCFARFSAREPTPVLWLVVRSLAVAPPLFQRTKKKTRLWRGGGKSELLEEGKEEKTGRGDGGLDQPSSPGRQLVCVPERHNNNNNTATTCQLGMKVNTGQTPVETEAETVLKLSNKSGVSDCIPRQDVNMADWRRPRLVDPRGGIKWRGRSQFEKQRQAALICRKRMTLVQYSVVLNLAHLPHSSYVRGLKFCSGGPCHLIVM